MHHHQHHNTTTRRGCNIATQQLNSTHSLFHFISSHCIASQWCNVVVFNENNSAVAGSRLAAGWQLNCLTERQKNDYLLRITFHILFTSTIPIAIVSSISIIFIDQQQGRECSCSPLFYFQFNLLFVAVYFSAKLGHLIAFCLIVCKSSSEITTTRP